MLMNHRVPKYTSYWALSNVSNRPILAIYGKKMDRSKSKLLQGGEMVTYNLGRVEWVALEDDGGRRHIDDVEEGC